MEQVLFNGSFMKSKNFIAQTAIKEDNKECFFDKALFEKVSKEIICVLGEKPQYEIFDAMEYFQIKYLAHRVPWKYLLHYLDPINYRNSYFYDASIAFEPAQLHWSETQPFNYDKEANVTLVVDTFYNKDLRKRYPNIEEIERQDFSRVPLENVVTMPNNIPVLTIGTLDKRHINSITRFYGDNGVLAAIPDIDYEIWYFYLHS